MHEADAASSSFQHKKKISTVSAPVCFLYKVPTKSNLCGMLTLTLPSSCLILEEAVASFFSASAPAFSAACKTKLKEAVNKTRTETGGRGKLLFRVRPCFLGSLGRNSEKSTP